MWRLIKRFWCGLIPTGFHYSIPFVIWQRRSNKALHTIRGPIICTCWQYFFTTTYLVGNDSIFDWFCVIYFCKWWQSMNVLLFYCCVMIIITYSGTLVFHCIMFEPLITDYFCVILPEIDWNLTSGQIECDDLATLIVFLINIKSKPMMNNEAKCVFVNKLTSLHVDSGCGVFVHIDYIIQYNLSLILTFFH